MGGDQLVDAVAGYGVERENGDDIREAEGELYMQMIDEVAPFEGARELIVELKRRGHAVVLVQLREAGRGRSLPGPARRP